MPKTLFRITYRIRAHHVSKFEKILLNEIMPVVRDLGIPQPAIWKGFVAEAGEYMELWEFDSMAHFEEKWRALTDDPRLQEIFQVTGPMVENEHFSLFEPLEGTPPKSDLDVKHYSV